VAESHAGESVELTLHDGDSVMDACDREGAPIPFCCRSASCGTCQIEVLRGAEQLLPAAADELLMLAVLDADPARFRLACQLRVRAGDQLVHLRALDD
jgi:2Fe-2S ferredoxin